MAWLSASQPGQSLGFLARRAPGSKRQALQYPIAPHSLLEGQQLWPQGMTAHGKAVHLDAQRKIGNGWCLSVVPTRKSITSIEIEPPYNAPRISEVTLDETKETVANPSPVAGAWS